MGNTHQELKYVHICGTNGKGSTSLIVANILSAAGYKVGRFTSPHIHSYRERFTINGEMITALELKSYIDSIEEIIKLHFPPEGVRPTEFELLTAIGFSWFKDNQVDIVVMEVGMGGLYDSTNVIIPEVSVITSVDLDHMEFLGHTVAEVAHNKAGIIKPEVPVVIGDLDTVAYDVIAKKANQEKAPIYQSNLTEISAVQPQGLTGYDVDIKTLSMEMQNVYYSLPGNYQLDNLATALTATEVLKQKGYNISKANIIRALANLHIGGRLEVIRENPLVIADVAHNPHGAKALNKALTTLLPNRPRILLCGIVDDKDAKSILHNLGNNTDRAVITRPVGRRSENWQRLEMMWQELYPAKSVTAIEDIESAVEYSLAQLSSEEYLLICGSFYVIDRARRYFNPD